MYLFPCTHKNDGFKIFSHIEGTCVTTISLDVTNEENMKYALPMESKKQELFILLQKLEVLMQESKIQFTSIKKNKFFTKLKLEDSFWHRSKNHFHLTALKLLIFLLGEL